MTRTSEAGFTLLEVLIALVILAVGAAGLIGAVRQDLGQQGDLERKTLATWVAENRLAELRAGGGWIAIGTTSGAVAMAGRDWAVTVTAAPIPNPDIESLFVAVGRANAAVDVTLTGYLGRH